MLPDGGPASGSLLSDGGLGLPLGLGNGSARPGFMMTSRPSRLTSAFSPLEVFLVSLFLQLPLAHPFGPVGQILQGPLIPLGVLQSLQKGQGQGRVGDGGQGYYALTQGRAQFLL